MTLISFLLYFATPLILSKLMDQHFITLPLDWLRVIAHTLLASLSGKFNKDGKAMEIYAPLSSVSLCPRLKRTHVLIGLS